MNDKQKNAGPGIAFAVIGMVMIAGFLCWAVVGVYMEVEASRQVSRARSEKVLRQIQEREREKASQQLSNAPPSENP